MAFTDKTRIANFHQKKGVSQAVVRVNEAVFKEFASAGIFKVVNLPPDAVITDAFVHTLVTSDAGTITLGTLEGGSEVLSAGDVSATGKSGNFTGQSATGTGKALYLKTTAAAKLGDFIVVVEYLEFTKNTGEYTKVDS